MKLSKKDTTRSNSKKKSAPPVLSFDDFLNSSTVKEM